jgi:hypothetical protein
MKVIVTCGPGYEPINQVRRLTNFSAGEVGVHLRNQLARAGFEVFCLKGSGATHQGPGERCYFPFQLAFHLCGASVGPRSPQRLATTFIVLLLLAVPAMAFHPAARFRLSSFQE